MAAQSLSSFAHAANVFFFTYSPKTRALLSWSTNAKEVLGVKDAEIIREGNLFLRHVHPRDRFLILSNLESSLEGHKPYEATYRWVRPDTQELRWLHCRAHLSPVGDEKVFEGIVIDLSAVYRSNLHPLGEQSAESLLGALKQVLFLFDVEGRILYQNGGHLGGFNFGDPHFNPAEVFIGRTLERAFSSRAQYEEHLKALSTAVENIEHAATILCLNKTFTITYQTIVDEDDSPQVIVRAYDVSQQLQLEEEVKKLSKMASYQVIASGVAHNINNALQTIIGEASFLMHNPADAHSARIIADRIMKLAHRTADLTHELLDLNSDLLTQVDLNVCTMTALNRVQEFLPRGMVLDVNFGGLEPCLGRQRSIIECISDLLERLWSTVPATKTTLRTVTTEISGLLDIILEGGEDLKLPDPLRLRILEITQLGLSISVSETDNRILISFSLPLTRERTRQGVPGDISTESSLVMVVDDDPLVGGTIRELLYQSRVHAEVFQDAHKALAYLADHSGRIGLIIVDAVMPILSGEAFIREVKKLFPSIPILGFTGAPKQLQNLLQAGASDVVLKPLDPIALNWLVRKYLVPDDETPALVGNS